MCNGNSDNVDLASGDDYGTIIRVPPCPEDPEQPHRDLWMERCEGILGSNGEPDENRMIHSFRNGRYQHIMFLGTCGYVICNHCDREILLVDPWPTHFSHWTRVTWLQEVLTTGRRARRELTEESLRAEKARQRIGDLASFLRNAVGQGYILSGILVSHMHFDHAEDVPLLLELLAARGSTRHAGDHDGIHYDVVYEDHRGLEYFLNGNPVPVEELPRICCDYDTLIYLLTYGFYHPYTEISIHTDELIRNRDYWYGNRHLEGILDERLEREHREDPNHFTNQASQTWAQVKSQYIFSPQNSSNALIQPDAANSSDLNQNRAHPKWIEISVQRQRLHYDDSYNESLYNESQRCRAGQQCDFFTLDNFLITPYVWDHMNTGAYKRSRMASDNQSAGHLQRITAYMISHKSPNVIGAKRTFIIGGMGEMSERYTQALADTLPSIETHLLILAATRFHPIFNTWYDEERADALSFLGRYITVRDAVIFTHFEEFVREIATPAKYVEDFRATILNEGMSERRSARMEQIQSQYYFHQPRPGTTGYESRQNNLLPLIEDLRRRSQSYNRLFERNRFYVLVRHGFEIIDFPGDPIVFKNQRNEFHSFRRTAEPQ